MRITMTRVMIVALLVLLPAVVVKTAGPGDRLADDTSAEKWEYLAVAGASSTNFTPTGNSAMRKQEGAFGREAFVLETQLDKLGAKGWELVSVAGVPNDPVYYFKRRK